MNIISFTIWLSSKFSLKINYIQNVCSHAIIIFKIISSLSNNIIIICSHYYERNSKLTISKKGFLIYRRQLHYENLYVSN